jgi:hypothetical protein
MHPSLRDILALKASQFQESGYYSYKIKQTFRESFLIKPEEIGPQVLTLNHLQAGFLLIFGLLALSFVAFLAECSTIVLKKLAELFVVCFVVAKFVRMKKLL